MFIAFSNNHALNLYKFLIFCVHLTCLSFNPSSPPSPSPSPSPCPLLSMHWLFAPPLGHLVHSQPTQRRYICCRLWRQWNTGMYIYIKYKIYYYISNLLNASLSIQCCWQRPCNVLSRWCNTACKISPAICHKSRASCPGSRFLSVSTYMYTVCMFWTGTLTLSEYHYFLQCASDPKIFQL